MRKSQHRALALDQADRCRIGQRGFMRFDVVISVLAYLNLEMILMLNLTTSPSFASLWRSGE